jgi:hypothetical protein
MSTWADTTALAELAAGLGRTGETLRQHAAASVTLLGVHGYSWAANVAGSSLEWVTTWAAEWQASLHTRIAMLDAAEAVPLAGALRWAPLHVDRRQLAAHGLHTG